MNRAFCAYLFCFWIWAGCHSRHSAHHVPGAVEDSALSGAPIDTGASAETDASSKIDASPDPASANSADPVDLDITMLYLKDVPKVSLMDLMSQDWKLEDADQPHWNAIFWDSMTDTRKYPEIALFKDFSVTENARCRIQMGKWELNKERRELLFHFPGEVTETYIIGGLAIKKLGLVTPKGNGVAEIKLSADAIVHRKAIEDPYYPANNQWRIPPKAAESDPQLRRRVKGCLHFFSLFFRDNYLRQGTAINYTGLPSCFTWYNGGISLQNKLDLDNKWIGCFYSEAQASRAYAMLAALLESHTLQWPEHPTSWVQETADMLEQMEHKF